MSDSDLRVYIHLVWAIKCRQPILPMAFERPIHRIFHSEARKLGCKVVASNGTADHVHLLVQMGSQVGLARLVNQMKGVTTLFVNREMSSTADTLFEWQNGYGAYSLGTNQIRTVIDYINGQKEHHANNSLLQALEPPQVSQAPNNNANVKT